MEFQIKGPFKENIYNLMREIGYHLLGKNGGTGEMSFVNPVGVAGREGFPRFHIFLKIDLKTQELLLDLHLDQKSCSYQGSVAHSGEYDGEIVEKEVKRIKQILQKL